MSSTTTTAASNQLLHSIRSAVCWRNVRRRALSKWGAVCVLTALVWFLYFLWPRLLLCTINYCQYYVGPSELTRKEMLEERLVLDWDAAIEPISVDRTPLPLAQIEAEFPDVRAGSWSPLGDGAQSRHRTAIIVPYRDRQQHLRVFLRHMHAYLQRNMISYTVFLIHQIADQTFNRAKLMNIGFVEAQQRGHYDCVMMHDVDLLPAVAAAPYNCTRQGPLHMIAGMDIWNWTLSYSLYFGGVCAFTDVHFRMMNGFSNNYWGWGGEDDDAYNRVSYAGLKALRLPFDLGRYSMAKHKHLEDDDNLIRFELLAISRNMWRDDGLNSLNYRVINASEHRLYTEVVVDLLEEKSFISSDELMAKWKTQT